MLNTFHTFCPITRKDICKCDYFESKETKNQFLNHSKLVHQLFSFKNPEFEKEFGKGHVLHTVEVPSNSISEYLPISKESKKRKREENAKPINISTLQKPISAMSSPLPFLTSPMISSPTGIQPKIPISPMSQTTPEKFETPKKKIVFDSALKKSRGRPSKNNELT
jgi:hypothetical protein